MDTVRKSTHHHWCALSCLALCLVAAADAGAQLRAKSDGPDYASAREEMVRIQIRSGLYGRTAIRDTAVLDAMRTVPRHLFVPEYLRSRAYTDSPLPIGNGQTISQPYIVAHMTMSIKLGPKHKVLEIGTGSGYQAAVLAEIVQEVYTIEIVPELGKRAAKILEDLKYKNIHTRIGDGYIGWEEAAPFDAIIVTAAPDHIPQPLIEQLKPGGFMVIPVGPRGRVQELQLIEKLDDGTTSNRTLEAVLFVPFTGEGVRSESKR